LIAWSAAQEQSKEQSGEAHPAPRFLVLTATGDDRLELDDRIAVATQGRSLIHSTTPIGFFQDEVTLFFPLITNALQITAQFSLRLRPEAEQALATRLWQSTLATGRFQYPGVQNYFLVRKTLDLLQLAAASGTPLEEIAAVLNQGLAHPEHSPQLWEQMGSALKQWRTWCLERGFLTYGILTELYWRYLLPHPTYQHHLRRRFQAVLADDVDEYPAVTRTLLEFLLDQGIPGLFTFNPHGAVRLGLGADPGYMAGLADRCQMEESLTQAAEASIGATWGSTLVEGLGESLAIPQLPDSIESIQTVSRAELLRQMAEVIVAAVTRGEVQPQEIAIIGPGVDAIARYTLRSILARQDIELYSLNDQRPLISSPLVRMLLTLLALIYPGLGRLIHREAIAEMLVGLSQGTSPTRPFPQIDPVRAGLITDHCFVADPDQPQLLPVTAFPRWDRLGYQATQSYESILEWIETQKQQQQQRLLSSPGGLLDRAIQHFLAGGNHLEADQLLILQQLVETAQHQWEVDQRLCRSERRDPSPVASVGQLIQLLQDGTITADPYPIRPFDPAQRAVTLATIYQYRSNRQSHRWHFWLDAGSPLWLSGGGGLWAAPLFQHGWSGRRWTASDTLTADQQRLQHQVLDLLSRVKERLYLCYSELATNGQEQAGPLLTWVNVAKPVSLPLDGAKG
jgi:hypothetical protein